MQQAKSRNVAFRQVLKEGLHFADFVKIGEN